MHRARYTTVLSPHVEGVACIIADFISLLRDPTSEFRAGAAYTLGTMVVATGLQKIIPTLTEALSDIDEAVCLAASEALSRMDELAAPFLIKALNHESEEVRFYAVHALDQMGEAATEAVPHLINALTDDNEGVRFLAAAVLQEIGTPEALKAVQAYEERHPLQ